MIPYGQHSITEEDIANVTDVLTNDRLTQGDQVEAFEGELADYFDANEAVVVNNGTTALHLAYKGLGLSEDDILYTVPNTFVATSNAALMLDAEVRFVDIDYETGTMDPDRLRKRLDKDEISKRDVFIVPVHFAGLPCPMGQIHSIAKDYNATIIEDACHAPGARYRINDEWIPVGSCVNSSATVFSFHPVKHFTTGEGGAVLTNDSSLANRLRRLRHHGIDKTVDPDKEGTWYYEMNELGMNGRLTDFQCALGRSQLSRMNNILEERRNIAARYDRELKQLQDINPLTPSEDYQHAYHLYVVRTDSRNELFEFLGDNNIAPQVHYIPVPEQPYYREHVSDSQRSYPAAKKHYAKSVSLPMFPELDQQELTHVLGILKEFFR